MTDTHTHIETLTHTHALAISFRLKSFYINIYVFSHTNTYKCVYACVCVKLCMCAHALVLYAHMHTYIHVCVCECVVIGSLRYADDIMQRRRQQSAKHLSQLPSVPLNVRVCVRAGVCVCECRFECVCAGLANVSFNWPYYKRELTDATLKRTHTHIARTNTHTNTICL